MKICFYCRIEGKGYGFLLPDDADKLRKFFAEHQNKPALEKNQAQAKNFCRVLDIRVPQLVEADVGQVVLLQELGEVVADVVRGIGMSVRPI